MGQCPRTRLHDVAAADHRGFDRNHNHNHNHDADPAARPVDGGVVALAQA
jgi:hypothetical protein